MDDFKKYLQEKNFAQSTIATYLKYIAWLQQWTQEEELKLQQLKYKDVLEFIRRETIAGKNKKHLNHYLTVIRHYWNFLLQKGKVKDNIAAGLFIKGVTRRLPHDILSQEELNSIYHDYNTQGPTGKRNKVMLGFIIFQGLGTSELKKLALQHIHLNKGEIEITGSRRNENRTLSLQGVQVLPLQQYILETRPLILALNEKQSDALFTSFGKGASIQNVIVRLFIQIKKQQPKVKNIKQLRSSVITNWLENHSLRQVQYMAGHRYVSSTEHYQKTNLDDLKNELNKFHPLN